MSIYKQWGFETVRWDDNAIKVIDQTMLPTELVMKRIKTLKEAEIAIKHLVIRGAPCIGVFAAYAFVLGLFESTDIKTKAEFLERSNFIGELLIATRPTAVNLIWAINRLKMCLENFINDNVLIPSKLKSRLLKEADTILEEDLTASKKIGEIGFKYLQKQIPKFDQKPLNIMTHCNAGGLATGGLGTALAIIYKLHSLGKINKVFVRETRPLLQGARLSAWELCESGIHTELIIDSAAAGIMQKDILDCIIVGADRIARNGDIANKVGTLPLAICANYFKIPFLTAAPISTFDMSLKNGALIPIEERSSYEVTNFYKKKTALDNIHITNPAFDITPNNLISAIITEYTCLKAPYIENIEKLSMLVETNTPKSYTL